MIFMSPIILLISRRSFFVEMRLGYGFEYYRFLLIWVLYSLISLVWVSDSGGWSRVLLFLISGVITTWLQGLYLNTKSDFIRTLKIVESLNGFFALFALYELFTGNYLFLTEDNLAFYGENSSLYSTLGLRIPISIFGNPNHYAVFLLFATVFSFILSKCRQTSFGRLYSTGFFLLSCFLLICTQSRASFIALLIAFLVIFFLISKRENIVRFVTYLFVLILISVPVVVINYNVIEPLLVTDLNTINSDLIRQNLLRNGLEFLYDSYFFGVGLGNIEYYMTFFGKYYTAKITNIHNWWMEILVSSGVLIFGMYILQYFKTMRTLYFISKRTSDNATLYISSSFFGLLSGLIVGAVGPSSLFISEWFLPVFGIVILYINLYKKVG